MNAAKNYEFQWDSFNGKMEATLQEGEYTIVVTIKTDLDHDFTEGRGEFTDTWQEGVLLNTRYERGSCAYKYFLPDYTVAARRADLMKNGVSRGPAEEMARQDAQDDMLIALDGNGYEAYTIEVSVYWREVTVGASFVGGYEMDPGVDFPEILNGIATEQVEAAMHEARITVARLRN